MQLQLSEDVARMFVWWLGGLVYHRGDGANETVQTSATSRWVQDLLWSVWQLQRG